MAAAEAEPSGGGGGEPRWACQRIGCEAWTTDADNAAGDACVHHPGPAGRARGLRPACPAQPIFHDGGKEWSCCRQRSHDFSLFLAIPGCARGRHTREKPTTAAPTAAAGRGAPSATATGALQQALPQNASVTSNGNAGASVGVTAESVASSCARCRGGYFCSEHAPVAGITGSEPVAESRDAVPGPPQCKLASSATPSSTKPLDVNERRTCRRKGCGVKFRELDNHDTACSYHPGPAVFHDRHRGWSCCGVTVKDFDEFLSIPPCARGWHSAMPDA
eukprot:SM000058S18565  [mRNA]  locus=s58:572941:574996:- [translate_table: standard]